MVNPLTLVMPLKPDVNLIELGAALKLLQSQIDAGLKAVGTVHFARFVVFDRSKPNLLPSLGSTGSLSLAVITDYDGDFDIYIQDFVTQIGGVFDDLLKMVDGGDALVPVAKNVPAFTQFIQQNDLSQNAPDKFFSLYCAYSYPVQQILATMGTG